MNQERKIISQAKVNQFALSHGFFARSVHAASSNDEFFSVSQKVKHLIQEGKRREALDFHYEDLVRHVTGGHSKIIDGREIDAVTEDALIQVKRSRAAVQNPKYFINRVNHQINATLKIAKKQGKKAEFWFKYGAHKQVVSYIEQRGGIVKTDLDGHTVHYRSQNFPTPRYKPAI